MIRSLFAKVHQLLSHRIRPLPHLGQNGAPENFFHLSASSPYLCKVNNSARELLFEILIDFPSLQNPSNISNKSFFFGIIWDNHISDFYFWDSTLPRFRSHLISHIMVSNDVNNLILQTSIIKKFQETNTKWTQWFDVDFHKHLIYCRHCNQFHYLSNESHSPRKHPFPQ